MVSNNVTNQILNDIFNYCLYLVICSTLFSLYKIYIVVWSDSTSYIHLSSSSIIGSQVCGSWQTPIQYSIIILSIQFNYSCIVCDRLQKWDNSSPLLGEWVDLLCNIIFFSFLYFYSFLSFLISFLFPRSGSWFF